MGSRCLVKKFRDEILFLTTKGSNILDLIGAYAGAYVSEQGCAKWTAISFNFSSH